mmetsp:Transcript_89035/g.157705  ORF Transcript_89035/g.157705 Transcript_89035/m.157705 type:complete len:391 (-) Transcript_89035:106-1278(-)|eukprot:CAMPEP_0197641232 /NCGR_PEP_ID=MMETSP1338-20131121/15259_1 /TAXON_ID=43686 ORGANISM="Pelagodinium beii, Strain RCC1491" /NCGR_SAMPLE_ID=MMETSP1338 /ASSEMBLY_ACC=CAM_ASM_000754 /LENGTH=390 /DNA_ID=CAMNT_0043214179 /DNA_START=39 /DNA_END=1211 /DNA_ORIENTATION=-
MASSAFYLGASLLEQVQNVGQVVEIGQAQVHQREQLRWAKKAYQLESQSIRLDVFDHAKEEIRSHHDTYNGRIDALLLVLALIWPFALATIQFSDPFVPQTASECEFCVEVRYTGFVAVWVSLMAIVLILPFWGILMLIRCKLNLDRWLEYSLARLNRARRQINLAIPEPLDQKGEDKEHDDTKEVVCKLVNMVAECQEYLALIWTDECGWLVHASTSLLWVSASAALMLTAESVWLFLVNKGEPHCSYAPLFAIIVAVGLGAPLAYVIQQRTDEIQPPSGYGEELSLARTAASAKGFEEPEERRRRCSHIKKSASSPNFSETDGCQGTTGSWDAADLSPQDMEGHKEPLSSCKRQWFCVRRNGMKKPGREPLLSGSDWADRKTVNRQPP